MDSRAPLHVQPRRIRIVGVSGSGKTHLAKAVSAGTGLDHLELDQVFWDAGWEFRDVVAARALVSEFLRAHADGWVIDGNWSSRLQGMLDRDAPAGPDLVVWLDYSRTLVMWRVVRRTLGRALLRTPLWHGNKERPSTWLSRDPHENIALLAWQQHPRLRQRLRDQLDSGDTAGLVVLSSRRETREWLNALTG